MAFSLNKKTGVGRAGLDEIDSELNTLKAEEARQNKQWGAGNWKYNIKTPSGEVSLQDRVSALEAQKKDRPLQALVSQQLDAANKYEKNIPTYSKLASSMAARQTRQGLSEAKNQIDSDFAGRGLIGSGMHQKTSLEKTAQAASAIDSYQPELEKKLKAQLQAMRDNAYKMDAARVAGAPYIGDVQLSNMESDIKEYLEGLDMTGDLLAGLGSGLGAGIGTFAANRKKGS